MTAIKNKLMTKKNYKKKNELFIRIFQSLSTLRQVEELSQFFHFTKFIHYC